jgi:hypothetical protein
MMLAGLPVPDALVLKLAVDLRAARLPITAEKLERAFDEEHKIVALTIDDRESILRALDDPPEGPLCDLRAVLVQEHAWRVQEGLVQPRGD